MRSFLLALLLTACFLSPLRADTPHISGHIVDPAGLPLPGVTVTLLADTGDEVTTDTSDLEGRFVFDAQPGRYSVNASLEGFTPATRSGLVVGAESSLTVDLQLALAVVRQDVTVTAPVPLDLIGGARPNAPVTVTRAVMDVAMLPNSQFDDVLPLMPNVVRGPDGLIAVAGARSESGGMVVNGVNASDPIGGGAGLMLPLEAVESMQVYSGGAPAEFGQATGGITAVHTRSGADRFHVSADSFLPRMLYTDSGVSGVAFWDPNIGLSGPIVKGRATFQQALSYRFDRNTFTTVDGPDHNLFTALLAWTQVDARLSSSQHARISFGADPRRTDHANVTAFTPSDVSPAIEQGGWTVTAADTWTSGRAAIETHASVLRTGATVTPSGVSAYEMAHDVIRGSYFDRQERRASVVDAGATITWQVTPRTVVTTGASLANRRLGQQVNGGTVDMFRSDGTLARTVEFTSSPSVSVASTTLGVFAQDEWTPRTWLTLDVGVRYDETSNAGEPAPSPRVSWSMTRDEGRTRLSGSIGLFSDALPLGALAFDALPARQITSFGGDSGTTGITIANVIAPRLHVPQATRWDLQFDRQHGNLSVRVRYEERHGQHELIVDTPGVVDAADAQGEAVATLASVGMSRARSVETTIGLHSRTGNEGFVSYVHSSTWGDTNTLDAVEGLLRTVFPQVNARGPLNADVPNRVLVWGLLQLPGRLTVAPFLDTRSGFPFTAIDDGWMLAGLPNGHRLPWMTSLDLSATRIIGLPHRLPDARVGLKLYNIVSGHTEREVQRDIERADFGTRYDPVPRDFSFVFELLWGRSKVRD